MLRVSEDQTEARMSGQRRVVEKNKQMSAGFISFRALTAMGGGWALC